MEFKVGDYVRILNNQGQKSLYKNGAVGKILFMDDRDGIEVEFPNGNSWWVWSQGDGIPIEEIIELFNGEVDDAVEKKIKEIVFAADAVAHLRGYEKEILPATELIEKMVDLLKEHDILNELVP